MPRGRCSGWRSCHGACTTACWPFMGSPGRSCGTCGGCLLGSCCTPGSAASAAPWCYAERMRPCPTVFNKSGLTMPMHAGIPASASNHDDSSDLMSVKSCRHKRVVAATNVDAPVQLQDAGSPAAAPGLNAERALREAGPENCACWLGAAAQGLRFATGHQQGDVLVWQLPPACAMGTSLEVEVVLGSPSCRAVCDLEPSGAWTTITHQAEQGMHAWYDSALHPL